MIPIQKTSSVKNQSGPKYLLRVVTQLCQRTIGSGERCKADMSVGVSAHDFCVDQQQAGRQSSFNWSSQRVQRWVHSTHTHHTLIQHHILCGGVSPSAHSHPLGAQSESSRRQAAAAAALELSFVFWKSSWLVVGRLSARI